jgi:type I restriction enzyme S subunit
MKVGDLTKDDGKYLYEASSTVNEFGKSESRYIEADTLMLTNSGATLGVPKITKIAGCFNDGSQAFLNLSPTVEQEYLYYFFKSKTLWFREWIARGQGQPNLNTTMTRRMDVPVPPLPEQRRVVGYLDGLAGQVAALARLQSETAAELDALLPSVFDRAFKGEF